MPGSTGMCGDLYCASHLPALSPMKVVVPGRSTTMKISHWSGLPAAFVRVNVILQGGISFNPSLQKSREDNSNTMTTTATELGLGAAGLAIRMGPAVLSPDNVRARS